MFVCAERHSLKRPLGRAHLTSWTEDINTQERSLSFEHNVPNLKMKIKNLQEWVCENEDYVPQLYTYGVVGSVLGTVVFRSGQQYCLNIRAKELFSIGRWRLVLAQLSNKFNHHSLFCWHFINGKSYHLGQYWSTYSSTEELLWELSFAQCLAND